MADRVEYIEKIQEVPRSDSGALLAVVLLIALLAIIGFALYAYNGSLTTPTPSTDTSPGSSINVEGQIQVPETTPGTTNPY